MCSNRILDRKKIIECADYIIESESKDFYQQVKDNNYPYYKWRDIPHIYVSALLATGNRPDKKEFGR